MRIRFAGLLMVLTALAPAQQSADPIREQERQVQAAIRMIQSAQAAYAVSYPHSGYACDLATLGPPAKGKWPSAQAANMLDVPLATGAAHGYRFRVSCDADARRRTRYRIVAEPIEPGRRAFCSDDSRLIRAAADGNAASCSAYDGD